MIYLEAEYLAQLKEILQKYIPEYEVRLFGSRVQGAVKPFSDIDLVIMNDAPLPALTLANLREAFSESDLPYKVDLVEWYALSSSFQKLINDCFERLI